MRISTNSAKNLRVRVSLKALWAVAASAAAVLLSVATFIATQTRHGHVVHQFSSATRLVLLAAIVAVWTLAVMLPYAD